MAVEIYKIELEADLNDRTEPGLRRLRRNVAETERDAQRKLSSFERALIRQHREAIRWERQTARHAIAVRRMTSQADAARSRAMVGRIRVQREEVALQRQQVQLQRQHFQVSQAQERHRRTVESRTVLGRLRAFGAGVLGGANRVVGGAAGAVGAGIRGAFGVPGLIAGVIGGAAVGAGVLLPAQLAMDAERAEFALTQLLGSAQKAKSVLADLKRYAGETPFELPAIRGAATGLLQAYIGSGTAPDVAIEKMTRHLTALGDVAAAQEHPAEALARLVRAYRQIVTGGRVMREELNQLEEAGLPATQMLARGYGITPQELREWMETSRVPASLRGKPIRSGLDVLTEQIQASAFAGMATKQSATTPGLISTVRDFILNDLLTGWGKGITEQLKPRLAEFVAWMKANPEIIDRWTKGLTDLASVLTDEVLTGFEDFIRKAGEIFTSEAFLNAPTALDKLTVAAEQLGMKKEDVEQFGKGFKTFGQDVAFVVGTLADLLRKLKDLKEWTDQLKSPTALGKEHREALDKAVGPMGGWAALNDQVLAALGVPEPVRAWLRDRGKKGDGGPPTPPPGGGEFGSLTGGAASAAQRAITNGMTFLGSREFINWCLKFIDDVFGVQGARFGSAWEAAQSLTTQTGGALADVPRGQLAFMRADPSNQMAGHVMLALGGGKFLDPSAQGVQITDPSSPQWDYYSRLFHGYGAHGTPAGATTAPAEIFSGPAGTGAGGGLAAPGGITVTIGDVVVQGAGDPEATASAVRRELANRLAGELARLLDMQDANTPLPRG